MSKLTFTKFYTMVKGKEKDSPRSSFLLEMPFYREQISFPKLENPKSNKIVLKVLKDNSSEETILKTFNGISLIKNRNYIYMALSDRIIFLADVIDGQSKIFGKFITQKLSWKDPKNKISGIFHYLFFDYYLKKYDTIISDEEQSAPGGELWLKLIQVASDKGFYIYTTNRKHTEYQKINKEELLKWIANNASIFWGKTENHRDKLLVISRKLL